MAFTDALVDHADVSVVMVDRRHGVGGHWLDAYPFVRLHQASAFYGVPSIEGRGFKVAPETKVHTDLESLVAECRRWESDREAIRWLLAGQKR